MFHKCSCRKVLVSWIKTTFDRDSKDSVCLSSFNIGSCNFASKGRTGWCQGEYMTGLMGKTAGRGEQCAPKCQQFSLNLQAWSFFFSRRRPRQNFCFCEWNRCFWPRCCNKGLKCAEFLHCEAWPWLSKAATCVPDAGKVCAHITTFPSFPPMDKTPRGRRLCFISQVEIREILPNYREETWEYQRSEKLEWVALAQTWQECKIRNLWIKKLQNVFWG